MKEIKIAFDNEGLEVHTGEMNGREFLTALGMVFIAGCEDFNVEPLSTIENLMDEENEAKPDPEDYEYWDDWEDDYDCCDVCGQYYSCCDCDDDFCVGGGEDE